MTKTNLKEKEEEYETVDLDLPNDVILDLALVAHEKNITLNQHINNILEEYIEELEKNETENPDFRAETSELSGE